MNMDAIAGVANLQTPMEKPSNDREAAEQVEALFVKLLLKEVRKSMPEDGMFSSKEMQMFTDMFDEQIAHNIAESGQLGLADAVEASLTGRPQSQSTSHAFAHRAYRRTQGTSEAGAVEGRITSHFGHRMHPILHERKMHNGIDIAAPTGTPIKAMRAGIVTRSERAGGYGKVVYIDHGDGLETRYAHANSLLVKPGMRVEAGDTIATVGSTGRSTGPHLHFEVRENGNPVDPAQYLRRESVTPLKIPKL